jgi:hypothetical protein
VERRIRDEPVEWLYAFDAQARQVLRIRGTEQFVAITDPGDERRLKDATVVHNHPVSSATGEFGDAFSELDLIFAMEHDVAELVAISGHWRFVVTRPEVGWPTEDRSIIDEVYDEAAADAATELTRAILEERLYPDEARDRMQDEIIRRVAAWGGFEYRREGS